jgi:hypothetical protein
MIASRGQFVRKDLATVEHGLMVEYVCSGFNFHVVATRAGVAIEGRLPMMAGTVSMAVAKIIRRAVRQHMSLNTPIGVKQQTLSEPELEAEEKALEMEANIHDDAEASSNGHGRGRLIAMPGGGTVDV